MLSSRTGTCPGLVPETPLRQTHSGQLTKTRDMTWTISQETVRSVHAVITAVTRASDDDGQPHICVMKDEDLEPLSHTLICHEAPPPDFSQPIRVINSCRSSKSGGPMSKLLNMHTFFCFFFVLADTRKTVCFNASH